MYILGMRSDVMGVCIEMLGYSGPGDPQTPGASQTSAESFASPDVFVKVRNRGKTLGKRRGKMREHTNMGMVTCLQPSGLAGPSGWR